MSADADPFSRAHLEMLFQAWGSFSHVLLAVSGGADSMALALLAQRWRKGRETGPVISAISIDHGLRPESGAQAQQTRQRLESLGLPCQIHSLALASGPALEERARMARYPVLIEAARALCADCVATAHHGDDQAETILHRLSMGSDLHGLRGMDEARRQDGVLIMRPLLGVRRAALLDVVERAGIGFVMDEMNDDPRFYRARVRKARSVLDGLGLDVDTLNAAGHLFGEANRALETIASQRLLGAGLSPLGYALVDAEALHGPAPIARRVAARLIRHVRGAAHVMPPREGLSRLIDGLPQTATLSGVKVLAREGKLVFVREKGRAALTPLVLKPGARALYDDRFFLENRGDESLVIGALGARRQLPQGVRLGSIPAEALETLPVVLGEAGPVRLCRLAETAAFDGVPQAALAPVDARFAGAPAQGPVTLYGER